MSSLDRLTPAAMAALALGDVHNALAASTPGGIEAQETAGQEAFVTSTTLPSQMDTQTRIALVRYGIEFGLRVDDLFDEATLPAGWTKRAEGNPMYSELLDDRGRVRAQIFYKAAFYDRRADISLHGRYDFHLWPEGVTASGDPRFFNNHLPRRAVVVDGPAILWESALVCYDDPNDVLCQERVDDALRVQALAWLDEHFPLWRDRTAYWD